VRWGDTDAAAIAYTGRLPDIMMEAIEAWFIDRLGIDWYRLNRDEGTGTPFAHLSMDFRSPITPREPLDVTVILAEAGRSSLSFSVTGMAVGSERLCFEGRAVCVFVDVATMRPVRIPQKYRGRVEVEAAARKVG
jgi:acyl-CoA thioesterase FadM